MATLAKVGKLKGILQDPANRPAVSLLFKSSIAMAILPLAVYFLCFNILLAEGVRLVYSLLYRSPFDLLLRFLKNGRLLPLLCSTTEHSRRSWNKLYIWQGIMDYSKDLNMRVNLSGIAAVITVQVCCSHFSSAHGRLAHVPCKIALYMLWEDDREICICMSGETMYSWVSTCLKTFLSWVVWQMRLVCVQLVIAGHVICAFRQDDEEFAKEAAAKKE